MNKFESDLSECRQFASQTSGAAERAAAGPAAGAIFGVFLAAAGVKSVDVLVVVVISFCNEAVLSD